MLKKHQKVIVGFCEIIDGLIVVLSLGNIRTHFSFKVSCYFDIINNEE